jgi:hypothetical protein
MTERVEGEMDRLSHEVDLVAISPEIVTYLYDWLDMGNFMCRRDETYWLAKGAHLRVMVLEANAETPLGASQ